MKIISIYSDKRSIEDAAQDIGRKYKQAFGDKEAKVALFFASSNFDTQTVSSKMKETFGDAEVFGCTSAGEIGSGFLLKNSIVVMVFDDEAMADCVVGVIENLKENDNTEGVFKKFESHFGPLNKLDLKKHVGIVLIDGMSGMEERLMDKIGNLSDLVFIGGSAGDDMKFKETFLYHNGQTYTNAAIVVIMKTNAGFEILKTQSFRESGKVLTATKVDEKNRVVEEFDGEPAVTAYARALGINNEQASDEFMSHPVGLMINGEPYVRSPQQQVDSKIKFYCNVKEGTELSILDSTDIVEETDRMLKKKIEEMGGASAVVNFHCILRTLELEKKKQTESYGKIFSAIPTIGFSTYGEQYIGHINQTSTMLIFK